MHVEKAIVDQIHRLAGSIPMTLTSGGSVPQLPEEGRSQCKLAKEYQHISLHAMLEPGPRCFFTYLDAVGRRKRSSDMTSFVSGLKSRELVVAMW